MSKIAIFLCAVLCASTANAYDMFKMYEIRQQKVDAFVEKSILKIYAKRDDNQLGEIFEKFQNLKGKHNEMMDRRMNNTIQKTWRDNNGFIKNINNDAIGRECVRHFDNRLYGIAQRAKEQVSGCISNDFKSGIYGNIVRIALETERNLTMLKKEAHNCRNSVDFRANSIMNFDLVEQSHKFWRLPAFRAILCTIKIHSKMMFIVDNADQILSASIGILADRITNIKELVHRCEKKSSDYSQFSRISSDTLEKMKQCIQKQFSVEVE